MKCPRCGKDAFVTKTRTKDVVVESYFCSWCFWDQSKDVKKEVKKAQQINIAQEGDLKEVIETLKKQLETCNNKTDMMKRFEKFINDFNQEGEI